MKKAKKAENNSPVELAEVLASAEQAGIFTRAFAACGSIDSDELTLSAIVGSSGQWFDLASITKALVTVPAVFSLGEGDSLSFLHSTLGEVYGAERNLLPGALQGLSLASLLAHRSGLSPWCSFWIRSSASPSAGTSPEELVLERISQLSFRGEHEPAAYMYSDIGFILLAFALEHYTGMSLSKYFYQLWVYHLGSVDSSTDGSLDDVPLRFGDYFDGLDREKFVSSGFCHVRGRLLQGEVHDENAAFLGGIAGHAGAFATGEGLCRYVRALVRSALGAKVVAANAALRRPGDNRGLLGWQQGTFGGGQCFGDGMAIGHLGFTGTALWYLPESRQYGVLLTNRVATGRTAKLDELGEVRRQVFSLFRRILDPLSPSRRV